MLDTTVKWFTSTNTQAPQINQEWGDITNILDACLVNGFGTLAVASATGDIVAREVVLTTSSNHKLRQYQVVRLSGFELNQMNTDFKIKRILSEVSFVIEMPDDLQELTFSGLLSVSLAPLGWEKPFSELNRGAYRSKDTLSNQRYLLVDNRPKENKGFGDYDNNAWAKWAAVGIVEDLEDLDTIVGMQCPYDTNSPRRNWEQTAPNRFGWAKWYSRMGNYEYGPGNNTGSSWVLVGDGSLFYFMPKINSNWTRPVYCFGDIVENGGNPYSTLLACHFVNEANSYLNTPGNSGGASLTGLFYEGSLCMRNFTGVGTHQGVVLTSVFINTNSFLQYNNQGAVISPNGYLSNFLVFPLYVLQTDRHYLGVLPGLKYCNQRTDSQDLSITELTPTEALLFVHTAAPDSNTNICIPFSVKSKWR